MNKTDKLLYGGFGAVALAVIVVMLVSVFSPPTQIVEETVETPKATVEKPIEDVPNQMERWLQGLRTLDCNENKRKHGQSTFNRKKTPNAPPKKRWNAPRKNGGRAGKNG